MITKGKKITGVSVTTKDGETFDIRKKPDETIDQFMSDWYQKLDTLYMDVDTWGVLYEYQQ